MAKATNGTTRQRKGGKKIKNTNGKQRTPTPPLTESSEDTQDQETVWQVIRKHPLFWALVLLGIPYGLHLGGRFVILQHPYLIPSVVFTDNIRPAVTMSDARQVLIIGTMSSGTSSIANELRNDFLEVGHEDSDSTWQFVRDGTVSWFHGIRYFPWEDEASRNETIDTICGVSWYITSRKTESAARAFNNYGLGPTTLGPPEYNCSFWHPRFQSCYRHACVKAMRREYGCATTQQQQQPQGCYTPYQKTLLQTREPWKIITSLTAKYCFQDGEIDYAAYPKGLKLLLRSLSLTTNMSDPCPAQMAEYVINYYNTILDHAPQPSDDDQNNDNNDFAVYPIEYTTLCGVAELAGIDRRETTIHPPNHDRYLSACGENIEIGKDATSGNSTQRARSNVINKGRVARADLLPHVTPELVQRIQALYDRLGYKYPEDVEVGR